MFYFCHAYRNNLEEENPGSVPPREANASALSKAIQPPSEQIPMSPEMQTSERKQILERFEAKKSEIEALFPSGITAENTQAFKDKMQELLAADISPFLEHLADALLNIEASPSHSLELVQ